MAPVRAFLAKPLHKQESFDTNFNIIPKYIWTLPAETQFTEVVLVLSNTSKYENYVLDLVALSVQVLIKHP
jgi:hypothetical protein